MPSTLLTLATGETTVRFREPFLTEGLNKKLAVNTPPGTYRGFRLGTSGSNLTVTIVADATASDHVAVFQTSAGASLTLRRTGGNFSLDLSTYVNKTVVIALFATYSVGSTTTAEVRAYELLPADEFTGATENAELIVLGTVVVPGAGVIAASSITHDRRRMAWEYTAAENVSWSPVLRNPGFEHGVSAVGRPYAVSDWHMPTSIWSVGHTFRLGTTVRSGAKSLELNKGAGAAGNCRIDQFVEVPVVPGQLVRVVGWIRQLIAPTGGSYTFNLYWGDLDSTAASSTAITASATGTDGSFRKVEQTVAVPSGVYVLKTFTIEAVGITTGSTGVAVVFDDVQVFVETGSPQALASAANSRLVQQKVSALLIEDTSTYALGQLGALLHFDKSTPASEGRVSLEREDQTYSDVSLPPALRLLGRLFLGESLLSTEALALLPRISAPVATTAGTNYTLLWESIPSGQRGLRIYAGDISASTIGAGVGFIFTINASFDGTNWNKDITGQVSLALQVSAADGVQVYAQTTPDTWLIGAWGSFAEISNAGHYYGESMQLQPLATAIGLDFNLTELGRAPIISGVSGDATGAGTMDNVGCFVHHDRFFEEDFTVGLNTFTREDLVGTGSTSSFISFVQLNSGATSGNHSIIKLNATPGGWSTASGTALVGLRARFKPNDVTNAEQRVALWDAGTNTPDVDAAVLLGFKCVNGALSVVYGGAATSTGLTLAAGTTYWVSVYWHPGNETVQWHVTSGKLWQGLLGGTYGTIPAITDPGGGVNPCNVCFSVKTSTNAAASGIIDYISVLGDRDDG